METDGFVLEGSLFVLIPLCPSTSNPICDVLLCPDCLRQWTRHHQVPTPRERLVYCRSCLGSSTHEE